MNDFSDAHWYWLGAAILLSATELLVPGVFLIWVAAAAALTGLIVFATDIPLAFQFAVFALMTFGALQFGRRWYARHPVTSSDPLLNDRTARLIGETVIVADAIKNGTGRVQVGDSVWVAKGPDMAEGMPVRIAGAMGTCLIVEAVDQPLLPTPIPGENSDT